MAAFAGRAVVNAIGNKQNETVAAFTGRAVVSAIGAGASITSWLRGYAEVGAGADHGALPASRERQPQLSVAVIA